ncbi:TIGR01777 family oxidoreductase [Kineococcus glutinatus]|uniref:TIGR01777 family oxidoreductase n=1 Tax=Kineococcus glutinatus TaxID=1070872 RepID=A0ABP8VCJ6_9ACTN
MRVVVSGASGLIGRALLPALRDAGHEVVQLVRRAPRAPHEVRWDPAAGELDAASLAGVDAAIHLSGAGVGEHRWTPAYKHVIRASRVDSTRTLARALAALEPAPRVLVSGSAIGAYGERGEEVLTEDSPRGGGFLADVVAEWEAATAPAAAAGVRVVHARTGLVAAHRGGAFGQVLPLLRAGLGGPLGSGRQWWSAISMPDEVAALAFLLEADVSGPVNLTAPVPAHSAVLLRAIAAALHRPAVLPVPALALRAVLGEFAGEVLASQRVVPEVLLRAGFTFTHPDAASIARWLADPAVR